MGRLSLVGSDRGRTVAGSSPVTETSSNPFSVLNDVIGAEIKTRSAVLDGEIVCFDDGGKPQFRDLLFRRGEPRLYTRFGSLRDRRLPLMREAPV